MDFLESVRTNLWIGIPPLFIAAMWFLLARVGSQAVAALRTARLEPANEPESSEVLERVFDEKIVDLGWADAIGFAPLGVFRAEGMLGEPVIVSWAWMGTRTYMNLSLLPFDKVVFEFVTPLEAGLLSTGNSRDAHAFPPPPGAWVQTFDDVDADALWAKHRDALDRLRSLHGLKEAEGSPQIERDFSDFLVAVHEHVNSITFWFLRVPYWFLVRRSRYHGKPVG